MKSLKEKQSNFPILSSVNNSQRSLYIIFHTKNRLFMPPVGLHVSAITDPKCRPMDILWRKICLAPEKSWLKARRHTFSVASSNCVYSLLLKTSKQTGHAPASEYVDFFRIMTERFDFGWTIIRGWHKILLFCELRKSLWCVRDFGKLWWNFPMGVVRVMNGMFAENCCRLDVCWTRDLHINLAW